MSNLIKGIVLLVTTIFIVYLLFAFVTLDLDFKNWSQDTRFAFAIVSLFFIPLIPLILEFYRLECNTKTIKHYEIRHRNKNRRTKR